MSVTGSIFKKMIFDGETEAFWVTESIKSYCVEMLQPFDPFDAWQKSENQQGGLWHNIKESSTQPVFLHPYWIIISTKSPGWPELPWVAPWVTWTRVYIIRVSRLPYSFYCSQMSAGRILKLHHLWTALYCCCCESVWWARPETCDSHQVMRNWGETSLTEVQLDQPIRWDLYLWI